MLQTPGRALSLLLEQTAQLSAVMSTAECRVQNTRAISLCQPHYRELDPGGILTTTSVRAAGTAMSLLTDYAYCV
jgi:hypothetical protein